MGGGGGAVGALTADYFFGISNRPLACKERGKLDRRLRPAAISAMVAPEGGVEQFFHPQPAATPLRFKGSRVGVIDFCEDILLCPFCEPILI